MTRPDKPAPRQKASPQHPPCPHAELDWGADGQPSSRLFNEEYYCPTSGLKASRYVFLQQNNLPQRWAELANNAVFTIAETGFGTGLNFLSAWQLWQQTAAPSARLHFVSVEKYPLHRSDFTRALGIWPELAPLAQSLIQQYPAMLAPGVHRLSFEGGRIVLSLVIGEACDALASLRWDDPQRDKTVDAWFLDGFAPSKNPEMWSAKLFSDIAKLSKPGTSFATSTGEELVEVGLKNAGFSPNKVAGFSGKPEMLCGEFTAGPCGSAAEKLFSTTPWHLPMDADCGKPISVAVIGGGISGATVARALAQRNIKVCVFEQGPQPGSGASGNNQGILYAKLSPKPGPNGDFNLHALLFALRYYQQQCPQVLHPTGLLQLAQSPGEQKLQAQIAEWLLAQQANSLAYPVASTETPALAGIPIDYSGLFFPQAGWLKPQQVCAALLQHKNIQLRRHTEVKEFNKSTSGWQIHTTCDGQSNVTSADAVIICTANGIKQFPQSAPLPLQPIRGQVSTAPATEQSRNLKIVLCGDGYIAPAENGSHSFGATFKLKDTTTELRTQEHRENLDTLAKMAPEIARSFSQDSVSGRAALRAATPDYLPMAGPLADWDSLTETYQDLRKNRKLLIARQCTYQQGLFVLGGLGSRGFTYAPLAAELVASWLCNETPPVNAELVKALHPMRFAIRALGKNRPVTDG